MEIIWTNFASKVLKEIFDYYKKKVNKRIANKIRTEILNSTKHLIENPKIGQIEDNLKGLKQDHRYLVSGNYKIIYRIEKKQNYNKRYLRHASKSRQNER